MNYKQIIQARIDFLTGLLAQAGKRLSAETTEKLNSVIASLQALLGTEDVTEETATQALGSADLLVQESVTGDTWAGTFEEHCNALRRALYADTTIWGSWKSPVWTWPSEVVIAADGYENEKYKTRYFRADYTRDGDAFTFSNVREVEFKQIVTEIAAAVAQAAQPDTILIEAPPGDPIGNTIAQGADKAPFFVQAAPCRIEVQADRKTGKVTFSGTATVADVVNSQGQVYPTEFWAHHVQAAQETLASGRMVGAAGHKFSVQGYPRMPEPTELTHRFTRLEMQGNKVHFEAETLSTAQGKDLAAVLADGVGLDMSTVVAAKIKRGKWQGKSVDLVQTEGSTLHCIDVVTRGASPGSSVDYAKLQAKELERKQAMDPKELLKLIQDAIASGDLDLVTQLQAQLDSLKDSLGQVKGLTPEQETLLGQAAKIVAENDARATAQARDAKAVEVVAKMVADKELPTQFQSSAKTILCSLAQSADQVEGKLGDLREALKPVLDAQIEMQSKGFYVAQYNQDGTTKAKLETPEQVINDIMQSAEVRGVLPKDTGVDEPSNMHRNVRVILQTMASDRPAYAAAYAAMKNRTVHTPTDMKHYLQQNFSMLTQDIPAGAMTTDDVAAAIPYLMGIAAEMTPMMVAARYASIQPMPRSQGTIAYWKIKDQDGNLIKTASGFTGSYANDPGEKQTIKRIKGALTTETITPTAKKLGYDLSIEVIKRLRTDWGMDASSIMITECANDIALELNYNHLQTMLGAAAGGAGNWTYGTAIPANSSFDGEQWQRQIMNYAQTVRAGIWKKTFASTKAILGDADAISRILWLAKEAGMMSDTPAGGVIARGVDIVGSLRTGEELVSVGWWEDLGAQNKLLFIGQGQEWYRSGYVVAPYGGPYVSPAWVDPETLDYMQSMMVETAEKMVDANYFATLTIAPGTPGVPL